MLFVFLLVLIGVLGTNGLQCYADGEKAVKHCEVFGIDYCFTLQCSGGTVYGCNATTDDILMKNTSKVCAETALMSGYCAQQEKGAYEGGVCKICEDNLCNEPMEHPPKTNDGAAAPLNADERDEDDMYIKSLAYFMRKLERRAKARFRIEIEKLKQKYSVGKD